ncbi:thiazolylpeptide-type bacteriocin [Micromonospora echinaurantiaca]|uniref:thiazolylpeptide-type bacteriocin n=1 Tax=Micromonospora echinaurantiaca TaxID=47857 RepID=UPI0037ABA68A
MQHVQLLQLHLVELQQHQLSRGAAGRSGRPAGVGAPKHRGEVEVPELTEELRALETETFEIEDVDAVDAMVMDWSSSSCSCSSCCSCSTSSCCSSSTSTGCGGG